MAARRRGHPTCGFCGFQAAEGTPKHDARNRDMATVECRCNLQPGDALLLGPAGCDSKSCPRSDSSKKQLRCALCLQDGHEPMTIRYGAIYETVRYRLAQAVACTSERFQKRRELVVQYLKRGAGEHAAAGAVAGSARGGGGGRGRGELPMWHTSHHGAVCRACQWYFPLPFSLARSLTFVSTFCELSTTHPAFFLFTRVIHVPSRLW